MILKKWLSVLLLLGFATPTLVYAQDDDDEYYDEEEEEAPVRKTKKKTTKKASKPDVPSRLGLSVSFGGQDGTVGLVYDLGGMEIGLGLGLYRTQWTPRKEGEGDDPVEPDPEQTITIVPSFSYELGKGLLNYGVGVNVGIIMEPTRERTRPDGGTSFYGTPYFYTSAELVKNLSLKLSAGLQVQKIAEEIAYRADYDDPTSYTIWGGTTIISFVTRGTITFYFL